MTDLETERRLETLIFEVTQRCNLDCLHCYNAWKNAAPYPAGELGTAETLALLDKALDECGALEVTLSGGEPLLRPDLLEIVAHLSRRGVEVDLISNGQLLDAWLIERLAREKIGVFELPLLSSDADVHDRLAGVEGAFERVTDAIAEIKLAEQRVVAVFVATRLNLPSLQETLEMALALGADGVMLNRFNPGGRGFDNLELLQATPEQLRLALDVADRFSAEYEYPVSCSIAMPPCLFDRRRWPRLGFGFCAAGTGDAYYTLDPMGNLRPCNHSTLILGNVRARPFWELVDGARLREFVLARPSFCDGCALAETCLGGCKAAAEVCYGDVRACDPFLGAFRGEAVKLDEEQAAELREAAARAEEE